MWPKFSNSSISMKGFILTSIWPEKNIFEGVGLGSTSKFGTGTRYGLEILLQSGKRVKTKTQ